MIDVYRKKNPNGVVYFEDAHYHDASVRRMCIETLYPYVDIMSMNEEELQYTLEMFKVPVDITDVLSCLNGVEFLREHCGVRKGVIVHTKDYALYAGDTAGFNIEQGLVCGSLMATAKATYGTYGTDAQIRTILKNPFSERGAGCQEIIRSQGLEDHVVVVPTFYLDRPKYRSGRFFYRRHAVVLQ